VVDDGLVPPPIAVVAHSIGDPGPTLVSPSNLDTHTEAIAEGLTSLAIEWTNPAGTTNVTIAAGSGPTFPDITDLYNQSIGLQTTHTIPAVLPAADGSEFYVRILCSTPGGNKLSIYRFNVPDPYPGDGGGNFQSVFGPAHMETYWSDMGDAAYSGQDRFQSLGIIGRGFGQNLASAQVSRRGWCASVWLRTTAALDQTFFYHRNTPPDYTLLAMRITADHEVDVLMARDGAEFPPSGSWDSPAEHDAMWMRVAATPELRDGDWHNLILVYHDPDERLSVIVDGVLRDSDSNGNSLGKTTAFDTASLFGAATPFETPIGRPFGKFTGDAADFALFAGYTSPEEWIALYSGVMGGSSKGLRNSALRARALRGSALRGSGLR
jgi:hypothetical protein